jgi:hypothetical protein
VTGGGRWPVVDGELCEDREAVDVVAHLCTMDDSFPLGLHHNTGRLTSFKVGGIDDDWLIGDGRCGEAEVWERGSGKGAAGRGKSNGLCPLDDASRRIRW